MTEPETKIELKFRRKDFEDIYFKNQKGDIFWSTPIKQHFVILLVFTGLFLASLLHSLFTNLLWGFPILFLLLLAISLSSYLGHAYPILKWKKQVNKYLDDLGKINRHEIVLSEAALTLTQDDEVVITKWITFTKVTLNEESILLDGSDFYIFPEKSMTPGEFKYLKDFITDKVKNGHLPGDIY